MSNRTLPLPSPFVARKLLTYYILCNIVELHRKHGSVDEMKVYLCITASPMQSVSQSASQPTWRWRHQLNKRETYLFKVSLFMLKGLKQYFCSSAPLWITRKRCCCCCSTTAMSCLSSHKLYSWLSTGTPWIDCNPVLWFFLSLSSSSFTLHQCIWFTS